MRNLSKIISVLFAITASNQLHAEQIKGAVVNENGLAVAGATVKIMGTSHTTATDEQGGFLLNVPPGSYELHVTAAQYAHENVDVDLIKDTNIQLNVSLDKTAIEIIDIKATPFHSSNIESALPISVLQGENLRMRQANTLGDTLSKEVGVHSNFHGGVASTPIIRGLDGPRVLITQNGLDAGDASRIGPDHAISTETSTTERIEVLRGPATLFYGSGAIGGVVNLVDERIPRSTDTQGEWLAEYNSNNEQSLISGSINTGTGNIAVHADGFYRDSEKYQVPEKEGIDEIANSAAESNGFTLGSSYLLDNGYVGVSYQALNQEYGIPGHSHGDEDVAVLADMKQQRWQLLSELDLDNPLIKSLKTKVAYTDYHHSELEVGIVGTTFDNQSVEARVEMLHQNFDDWRGGLSLHYKYSDFTAVGAEAFTPPSETNSIALAWIEERHFGDVLLQLGARIEHTEVAADKVRLPSIELVEDHSEATDTGDSHDTHAEPVDTQNFGFSQAFTPVSLSTGLVWDFTDGYNVGLSLSHSNRAPTAAELLSFGPHIGTGSYEVGALFSLHEDEGEEPHFTLAENDIVMETSNNIDLSLRKFKGDFGFIFNAFYNQIDNYYYEQATKYSAGDGHDHSGHDHGASEEAEHTLPLFIFTAQDATLHGLEAQAVWQMTDEFSWKVQGDIIRARLNAGGELPRTPPARITNEFSYQGENISANLFVSNYFEQDKTASLETPTDGYVMVDVNVNYYFTLANQDLALYIKGKNLTDEYAQVHTSFLKELTPLAGRSVAVGVRGTF